MRLDFLVAHGAGVTRKQARTLISRGRVLINGAKASRAGTAVAAQDVVLLDGAPLTLPGHRYVMLHKPQGVVCSTDDPDHRTVIDLMPGEWRRDLHPAGRLDVDTTGLVLLTTDGAWSHRITAPTHHLPKTYRVTVAEPLSEEALAQLRTGVLLRGEDKPTKDAQAEPVDTYTLRLTIREGRYHQVKRMLAVVGNRVTALHRERIGDIVLDAALEPGSYRELTDAEIDSVGGDHAARA